MTKTSAFLGNQRLMLWLASGARGQSSNAMVQHLTGIQTSGRFDHGMAHPYDPDDLDRCLALLDAVPLLRVMLPEMRSASPEWAALIDRWDEIEASHLNEVGLGWTKARSAPKTYELMAGILRAVREESAKAKTSLAREAR